MCDCFFVFTIFTLCLKKLVAEEEEVIEKNTDITYGQCTISAPCKKCTALKCSESTLT